MCMRYKIKIKQSPKKRKDRKTKTKNRTFFFLKNMRNVIEVVFGLGLHKQMSYILFKWEFLEILKNSWAKTENKSESQEMTNVL